ncbi:Hypothetical predicted protein [Octopus vulgaris]|uniref:Uncharacterized protein n=1 Tax=Octopus vulgaris TaxID=6645 RepID=A0AA36B509_OCTVU|nr:Hypothetical predicted protein [Octopus vulgaris]
MSMAMNEAVNPDHLSFTKPLSIKVTSETATSSGQCFYWSDIGKLRSSAEVKEFSCEILNIHFQTRTLLFAIIYSSRMSMME